MIDLITGHQGVSHISAEQVSTLNRILSGDCDYGTIMRMKDGEIHAGILSVIVDTGYWRLNGIDMEIQEPDTILLDEPSAGNSRIDMIYVELLQDIATGNQRCEYVVVQGVESITPTVPDEPTEPANQTDELLLIAPLAKVTVGSDNSTSMQDYTTKFVPHVGLSIIDGKINITYNE